MRIIDGTECADHRHGEWECQLCGAINRAGDACCKCEHEAERREEQRRAVIERQHPLDSLARHYELCAALARNARPPRWNEAIFAADMAMKLRAIRRALSTKPLSPAEAALRCRAVMEAG